MLTFCSICFLSVLRNLINFVYYLIVFQIGKRRATDRKNEGTIELFGLLEGHVRVDLVYSPKFAHNLPPQNLDSNMANVIECIRYIYVTLFSETYP